MLKAIPRNKKFIGSLALFILMSASSPALGKQAVEISHSSSRPKMNVYEVENYFQTRLPEARKSLAPLLASHLMSLCKKYRFEPAFILSVIHVESGFRAEVISKAGAVGLMQLRPDTARYIASKDQISNYRSGADLKDMFINMSLGVSYLSYLRGKFKNPDRYIAAYNLGPSRTFRMIQSQALKKSVIQTYVNRIYKNIPVVHEKSKKFKVAELSANF